MPKGSSGKSNKANNQLRNMSDMSGLPESFRSLTVLAIPYLRQQYKDWSSLENAMESIEYSPTAHEGNRYQDFQGHIVNVIKQNRNIANQLNEYYNSDSALANDILDVLRGRWGK